MAVKIPVTTSGIEPATRQPVVQCLNCVARCPYEITIIKIITDENCFRNPTHTHTHNHTHPTTHTHTHTHEEGTYKIIIIIMTQWVWER